MFLWTKKMRIKEHLKTLTDGPISSPNAFAFIIGKLRGLETRILRLPDVFGPLGPWLGGRESAPAELCRKIAGPNLRL
jgi:hypothetical protein